MVFAQMTSRDGLRDIATCLNARTETLYHLGFTEPVAKSTLADANETRDWRIWEGLAKSLMKKARPLYAGEDLGLDLDNTIYALDSTTIDLSLTLFPWADFRQTKAGIKLHTQIDLRGPIPTCICITGARQHDVGWLDSLLFEAGAFYLMDRGYMDFSRLILIANAGAFFVTRAKSNLQFTRHYSKPVDRFTGLRSDHVGKPTLTKSRNAFPVLLRKVRYYDSETSRELVFLTNNLEIPALTVAMLYKARWSIELFFRWIKGHLRIKHYYGTSPSSRRSSFPSRVRFHEAWDAEKPLRGPMEKLDLITVTRMNQPCPWLPEVREPHDFTITRRHGSARGAAFYQDALRYAQSLWISGKPAQALLQLDKAWMADLATGDPVLRQDPPPYQALAWLMQQAAAGNHGYLGNPVRHFQHLASRMSGPRAEIRSWRAWLCMHLAGHVLPRTDFLLDGCQLAREGLWIPGLQRSLNAVAAAGWTGEADAALCAFREQPDF